MKSSRKHSTFNISHLTFLTSVRSATAFFIGAILTFPLFAQGPDAHWRTIVTQHFRIHFPAESGAWATLLAADIESVRAEVVHEVGFAPEQVTDIVIGNPIADSNGVTLPLLDHPRILLFTEPPQPASQIGEFRTWIDLLITHEMTHLIHLLRPSRNRTQRLLAQILPLNPISIYAPRWVLEGYATVVEGRLTGSGRPASSIRAAILRKWAVSGRLPSYAQLNSDRRFAGMSMAYLVGSAYLEWLEQRSGPDSLRHLWARMTAMRRRSFEEAFTGVFGDPPERLYDRFTAELTERAMTVTRSETLREGDLWQETERATGDPAVSPDGSRLALVQRDEKGEAKLVVLSTGPNPEEQKSQERIEKMLKRDPFDIAPVRIKPFPRKPLFTLKLPDGRDIETPRWTRDGKSILYSHKQPDREGFLHHDLFLWTPGESDRRVTHLADVEDGDPLPDGARAIAVRNRDGFSQLVYVNLSSGEVTPYNEQSLDRIYSHPRAAADGRIAFAEHDRSGWHVGNTSGAFSPEWSGTHLVAAVATGGMIDIARIDNGVEFLTRTAGAAVDPAPAPDGSLYFMSLEPDGFVVRHLPNLEPALSRLEPFETRLAPAIPPVIATAVTYQHEPVGPSRAYGFGRQELSGVFGGAWTSYERFQEIGVRAGDVIGRLNALAIFGHRNGALIATWRGWPVDVTAHAFRHGLELRGNYDIHTPLTLASLEAGALGGSSSRGFFDGSFMARRRKESATARIAFDSRQHARASLRAAMRVGGLRVAASVEAAHRMTLGGVASSTDPDSLLIGRVLDPALPPAFAAVRSYRCARVEISSGGLTAFWQRHSGDVNVRGLEASLHAPPVPLLGIASFDLTAGVARVDRVRGTKGWINLRWRP
jgi:hypothetical protein